MKAMSFLFNNNIIPSGKDSTIISRSEITDSLHPSSIQCIFVTVVRLRRQRDAARESSYRLRILCRRSWFFSSIICWARLYNITLLIDRYFSCYFYHVHVLSFKFWIYLLAFNIHVVILILHLAINKSYAYFISPHIKFTPSPRNISNITPSTSSPFGESSYISYALTSTELVLNSSTQKGGKTKSTPAKCELST